MYKESQTEPEYYEWIPNITFTYQNIYYELIDMLRST